LPAFGLTELEPAAIRWHGRLEVEAKTLTLAESRFRRREAAGEPAEGRV
jgi:hypothetical protein